MLPLTFGPICFVFTANTRPSLHTASSGGKPDARPSLSLSQSPLRRRSTKRASYRQRPLTPTAISTSSPPSHVDVSPRTPTFASSNVSTYQATTDERTISSHIPLSLAQDVPLPSSISPPSTTPFASTSSAPIPTPPSSSSAHPHHHTNQHHHHRSDSQITPPFSIESSRPITSVPRPSSRHTDRDEWWSGSEWGDDSVSTASASTTIATGSMYSGSEVDDEEYRMDNGEENDYDNDEDDDGIEDRDDDGRGGFRDVYGEGSADWRRRRRRIRSRTAGEDMDGEGNDTVEADVQATTPVQASLLDSALIQSIWRSESRPSSTRQILPTSPTTRRFPPGEPEVDNDGGSDTDEGPPTMRPSRRAMTVAFPPTSTPPEYPHSHSQLTYQVQQNSQSSDSKSDETHPTQQQKLMSQKQSSARLPPVPLKPFRNQVGGHSAIYKFTKRAVCKVSFILFCDDLVLYLFRLAEVSLASSNLSYRSSRCHICLCGILTYILDNERTCADVFPFLVRA